ncbi:EAL domain-containing protein [Vibrio sp. SCSIO 43169]|uniref:EAL domain-containing protein n=1 Tax=Vibrio sp. SCSIO 43169 TaxID=2822801 RepID=UPI0020442136|nr:EAL domain-containing protein [Vibrio sp. SCSIO 43169]MCM5510094.1 EAL domain-containing protein [Vibrio sp. SCSIO 43169]
MLELSLWNIGWVLPCCQIYGLLFNMVGFNDFYKSKGYGFNTILCHKLYKAIKNNHIFIVFQPIVNSAAMTIDAFEVLSRWNDDVLGEVSPERYIPILEKMGWILDFSEEQFKQLCVSIGRIDAVCTQSFQFNVNLSVVQLRSREHLNRLLSTLDHYHIRRNRIVFEITESHRLEEDSIVMANADWLRQRNVGIALDDLGAGKSSLVNVVGLPLNQVKIDKMVIQLAPDNTFYCEVIEALVRFGNKIGFEVVAEGVEDLLIVNLMKSLNVHQMQGYYFSKPNTENYWCEKLSGRSISVP